MPFPNFHAARVENPELFFRIRVLRTLDDGVMIYGGPLKNNPNGPAKTQTYRFPKSKFSVDQAKRWLQDRNVKYQSFERAVSSTQSFNVKLLLKIASFSQNQIIKLIPQNIYDQIISKDKHPFFAMYSICHDGVSSPAIIGEKQQKITWTRKAIQSIKDICLKGVKLFKGHNKDSSHSGRKVIGEVIHSFEKEMNGKLHHLVITYHLPSVRDEIKNYDVCSQEAEWNFFEAAGKLIADTVERITGIALASSNEEMPAFAEAKRLGYVQAFLAGNAKSQTGGNNMAKQGQSQEYIDMENIEGLPNVIDNFNQSTGNQKFNNQNQQLNQPNNFQQNQPPGYQQNQPQNLQRNFQQNQQPGQYRQTYQNPYHMQQQQNDDPVWTYEQLKKRIKELKVYPSQLFAEEDLKADREFVNIFSKLQIMEEDVKSKESKIHELERQAKISTAKDRIDGILKKDKIPEIISDLVIEEFEKTKDRIDDLSDEGLKNFVAEKTDIFQRTAKKVNPEFNLSKESGDNKTGGNEDLTKAANNELLDEDYDE